MKAFEAKLLVVCCGNASSSWLRISQLTCNSHTHTHTRANAGCSHEAGPGSTGQGPLPHVHPWGSSSLRHHQLHCTGRWSV